MDARRVGDRDREAWDAYVRDAPLSTFFHLSGWRDVWSRQMGSMPHYLLAIEGKQITGVLPLIHVKSRLSGDFFTSLPGGLCADGDEAATILLARAQDLVEQTGASYLILRDGLHRWELPSLVTNEDHCTFWIDVSDGAEEARARMRRSTRKYAKRGLRAGGRAHTNRHHLTEFYPVYAQAMRERGTPTPGQHFFDAALDRFPRDLVLLTVSHKDTILGGGWVARLSSTLFCTWSGLPRAYFDLYNSYLLYWGVLDYAAQLGVETVDMGRCQRGSGSYRFKAGWGGEERTLYQQVYLNGIERPPRVGAGLYQDPKYRIFLKAWQHLPLWVIEAIGPQLRKRMPFG
jgi:FemAB-related protein (PEP-CTERM system-associated)